MFLGHCAGRVQGILLRCKFYMYGWVVKRAKQMYNIFRSGSKRGDVIASRCITRTTHIATATGTSGALLLINRVTEALLMY